jgi:hypothetical protein
MDELIRIGELMSNVFYNWSQDDKRFDENDRLAMKSLQIQWDTAYLAFRQKERRNGQKPPAKTKRGRPRKVEA